MEHEQVEQEVARKSTFIYLPLTLGVALIFWLAASLSGYPLVARIGGTIWVWLLTLIVTMPLMTTWVKRQVRENS